MTDQRRLTPRDHVRNLKICREVREYVNQALGHQVTWLSHPAGTTYMLNGIMLLFTPTAPINVGDALKRLPHGAVVTTVPPVAARPEDAGTAAAQVQYRIVVPTQYTTSLRPLILGLGCLAGAWSIYASVLLGMDLHAAHQG